MADEEGDQEYKLYPAGSTEHRESGSQKFLGHGDARYKNGDSYVGQFVEGFRKGRGTYTFAKSGDKYEGDYSENAKHGFGKITYLNKKGDDDDGDEENQVERGGTYLGHFSAGMRGCTDPEERENGMSEGTFTYVNGDVYVGQWQEGKKHGWGTYSYSKNQTKLIGTWVKGKIINGKWIFPNGTMYVGDFQYNKPCGMGAWVFKNGNQLTGKYLQEEIKDENANEDPEAPQPDPKVRCRFEPEKAAMVRGGIMTVKT